MKKKQILENFRKMKTQELIKEKESMKLSLVQKSAKLTESGTKSSTEIKSIRKNLARIDTLISERLDEIVNENEDKNA